MNDKQALRKLIEAVEEGALPDEDWRLMHDIWSPRNWHDIGHNVRYSMHGSLDAAKALHEALLPGWKKVLNLNEFSDGSVVCTMFGPIPEDAGKWEMAPTWAARSDNPARAWILAILRAYEAQQ